jgi:hypothetical protein
MTKRPLYARLRIPLRLAAGIAALLAASAPGLAQPAPCATCLLPVVTAPRAAAFPERLEGIDVLVRVRAGAEGEAAGAIATIAQRGGRPGLLIEGMPSSPVGAVVSAHLHTVLIRLDAVPDAAAVFALKTLLTATRAAVPTTMALGVSVASRDVARELAPYIDFAALEPGAPSYGLTPEWRFVEAADLDGALAATESRDVARWVWLMPDTPEAVGRLLGELTRPADHPVEDVQVVAPRRLTVNEIVARHQATAARQTGRVRQLISTGTLTITFEAPGFAAPITVTSDTIVYAGRDHTDLEQRNVRVNGVAFKDGGVPRLPIIEPERVASAPLAITLTNVYRYAWAGEESVRGTRCYVVAFEPAAARGSAGARERTLFRGRAWIASGTFAMLKVAATQTGLRGAIVSAEQIDEFREEPEGMWLVARSEMRQLYEGAGHRTPITRVLSIARHEVNPPDFDARRAAAYASTHVMLRDTPQGYRYLKRTPSADAAVAVEPVVAGRSERIRTLAAGVIIDPNISRPLPFAGLSYVDFNLLGTGAQLNAFLGGTYGQLAVSVPALAGSRWQLAGRAFGIATSYNDRAFVDGRERYEHNLLQRPAHAAVWLLHPLTTRVSLRVGYDVDYTHFARASGTAVDFVAPPSQLVHGARVALDAQRAGWAASAWWNPATRQAWRRWGAAEGRDYRDGHKDFQRYGASVSRSLVITPAVVGKIEGAWMSGRDLDRFSRYAFGSFDNRLRGYPSALIRYDTGGVVRTVLTWAPGSVVRFDAFLDSAAVRDAAYGGRVRNYTGAGGAIEAPAPFGTLIAIEWGYGFRGVNTDGRLGTQVVRISAFKIF